MAETGVDACALAEEQRRLRELRAVVDLAAAVIAQGALTRSEGWELVAATRRRAVSLFPDKAGTFDLILAPRFRRLVEEFTVLETPARGKLLPFRRPAG
jgi:hypothetical protein